MINIVDMTNYLDNDLEEVLAHGVSVLKFYKDGCAPCSDVSSQLNQLFFDDRADATIYNVKVSDCPEVAGEFSVFSVPTLVFLKDGEEYHRHNGLITKEKVLELIQK